MRAKRLFKMTAVKAVATILLWMGSWGLSPAAADTVTVFAAASTSQAVTRIGALFTRGHAVRFLTSFASSSTLAKQIENGAPADVYLSANSMWMDYLEEKLMIAKSTRIDLLGNRLVLIVPADSPVHEIRIAPGFDLSGMVGDGRLSMGDPDHVPAGIYGKKALEHLGVWTAVDHRAARCRDVRAALALVERGEAPLGVVYASDAVNSPRVRVAGTFPASSHPPIVYPVAVVAGRRSAATDRFMELLRSPEAGTIFREFGFSVR